MFEGLLDELETTIGNARLELPARERENLIGPLLSSLSLETESLFAAAEAVFGTDIFARSEVGFEYSTTKEDAAGRVALMPEVGSQYVRRSRDAWDVSLEVILFRGMRTQRGPVQPSVDIELEIRGRPGKQRFESLYRNYRAQIGALLTGCGIALHTS